MLSPFLNEYVFIMQQQVVFNWQLEVVNFFPVNAYTAALNCFSCLSLAWKDLCFRQECDNINTGCDLIFFKINFYYSFHAFSSSMVRLSAGWFANNFSFFSTAFFRLFSPFTNFVISSANLFCKNLFAASLWCSSIMDLTSPCSRNVKILIHFSASSSLAFSQN